MIVQGKAVISVSCVQSRARRIGEKRVSKGGKEGVLMVYVIIDLMLRIRCKIEMNAAQLRFRYINLAHVKSAQRGRVS
eukprot:scaffold1835_cov95-Skeletonema_dohrnii-CCMP3373.AAC.5